MSIRFAEQLVSGVLTPWVMLPGPYRIDGSRPSWVPVRGTFPAPGEGCLAGPAVPLDEPVDVLGDTPRAAYELARSGLPPQPVRAAWEDASRQLTWTELTIVAGAPTHACLNGDHVDVYTSLHAQSADGLVDMEPSIVANVYPPQPSAGQARTAGDVWFGALAGWVPRAEFESSAGLRDLDLGRAEYGTVYLSQSFSANELRGELSVHKWEDHDAVHVGRPNLVWCAGAGCERYWCSRAAPDDGTSCLGL